MVPSTLIHALTPVTKINNCDSKNVKAVQTVDLIRLKGLTLLDQLIR